MRTKIGSTGSFLPVGSTAEAAQEKAADAIVNHWAVMAMIRHRADADEPRNPWEADHEPIENNIAAEPTGCLGAACYMRSDACEVCPFSNTEY